MLTTASAAFTTIAADESLLTPINVAVASAAIIIATTAIYRFAVRYRRNSCRRYEFE